jgi:hypothetical protein
VTMAKPEDTLPRKDGVMESKSIFGAHARTTGAPCKAKALPSGRCKLHGGMSTGPKTVAGRNATAEATSLRMATGQLVKAMDGFKRWLDGGGRSILSELAKKRERQKRYHRKAV